MNRGSKGLFTKYGQPFSKWWNQFRAEVAVVAMKDPLEPFMSVGDRILTLRTGYHTRRNSIVVPWMLMLTGLTLYFIYDSSYKYDLESQKAQAARMIDFHKERASQYERLRIRAENLGDIKEGAKYQQLVSGEDERIQAYSLYFEQDGNVTLLTHMEVLKKLGRLDRFLSGISFLAIMCALSLGAWLVFLLKPRDAEVYFDRQRQIVYTWRHGRVGAAKFDKMGIIENHLGLNIILQFENKKKTGFEPMAIVGIDIGKLTFHKEDDMTYTLAQILAFMDHGKEAIITGNNFQREPAKYFLRKDRKPADFERRLEAVLEADTDLVEHYQTKKPKGHAF
ncbi:hypothetical protein [Vibrio mexicanus]|uniref:hypothetical protein n=1 Tax=Vibrio mexicanus TaxID=1004326 RepID=UPI00063C2959|nr:hypothetical protein [Vibrio mexicanus]